MYIYIYINIYKSKIQICIYIYIYIYIYTSGTRAQAHTQMFGNPVPGARKFPKHLLVNMCRRVLDIWDNLFFYPICVYVCARARLGTAVGIAARARLGTARALEIAARIPSASLGRSKYSHEPARLRWADGNHCQRVILVGR